METISRIFSNKLPAITNKWQIIQKCPKFEFQITNSQYFKTADVENFLQPKSIENGSILFPQKVYWHTLWLKNLEKNA